MDPLIHFFHFLYNNLFILEKKIKDKKIANLIWINNNIKWNKILLIKFVLSNFIPVLLIFDSYKYGYKFYQILPSNQLHILFHMCQIKNG